MTITSKQRLQLAAEAGVDPRTIDRVYAGKPSKALVRERIAKAVLKLRLPKFPEPAAAASGAGKESHK